MKRACIGLFIAGLVSASTLFAAPIHTAAKKGDLAKIQGLVKAKPELVSLKNPDGETPLHCACASGQKAVAEFLLANGADLKASDGEGMTPLHHAATATEPGVISLLLAKGAEVDARDNEGVTPL
nr:ankyrin repeat domain-containing protein [Candidatus Ozemobacteraceae bacterium]